MKRKIKPYKAWSWAIEGRPGEYELCYWVRKNKKADVRKEGKPSPEAKLVRVEVRPI